MSIFDPLFPGLDPDPEPAPSSMAAIPPIGGGAATSAAASSVAATTRATTVAPTTAVVVPTTSAAAPTSTREPTTQAPVVTPSTTATQAPVVPTTAVTTSAAPSFSTTSIAPVLTTSTVAPVTTSTTTPPVAATTSTPAAITITSTQPRPSLVTTNIPSSRSSAAAAASGQAGDKGGIGGSGLSVGALVGIIIGGLAAIALVGFLVTHRMRKKARSRRTMNRSSMFEPWPAPAPVALEDEPYEKSRFDAPSQSYAMQDQSYDPYTNAQHQAYGAESQPLYADQAQPGAPGQYNYQPEYAQGYTQYPPAAYAAAGGAGVGAGMAAAAGAGMGGSQGHEGAVNPATGLADGMMVRVKVGFVRTLEDELAITPDQQLYLHNQYDDGWSLCEDQNQNRGVVPVSCLEPWTEHPQHSENGHLAPGGQGMPRSNTAESLTGGQRRSSLYQAQNAGQAGY